MTAALGSGVSGPHGQAWFVVSSKTGPRREGRRLIKDFSAVAMRANAEGSLKRLRRETIDVFYLQGRSLAEINKALPALAALDHAVESGVDAIMSALKVIERRRSHLCVARKRRRSRPNDRHKPGPSLAVSRRPPAPVRQRCIGAAFGRRT